MFIACSFVIDMSYTRPKAKRPVYPWIGFFLGFAIVEVSNYLGMEDNWIGKAIGILTPVIMLIMKKVLSYQLSPSLEAEQQTVQTPTYRASSRST
jgi:hypothetical protein